MCLRIIVVFNHWTLDHQEQLITNWLQQPCHRFPQSWYEQNPDMSKIQQSVGALINFSTRISFQPHTGAVNAHSRLSPSSVYGGCTDQDHRAAQTEEAGQFSITLNEGFCIRVKMYLIVTIWCCKSMQVQDMEYYMESGSNWLLHLFMWSQL